MSSEPLAEPVTEPVTEPAVDPDAQAPVEAAPETDVEIRARSQGWRPLDEFNKDPSEFRSAEEFLEVADTEMPVLRERLRNTEKTVAEMGAAMEFQKKENALAVREERERIEAEYNARMRDTVVSGDEAAFDRLSREKEDRLRVKESVEPDVPVAIKDFMAQNEWYGADENMTDFANAQNIVVRNRHPDWNDDLVLRQIKAQVRQAYPAKFTNTQQRQVEGGRRPIAQPKGQTFDNLPANYKAGFEQSVRAGLIPNDEGGRIRFAEVYYSENE